MWRAGRLRPAAEGVQDVGGKQNPKNDRIELERTGDPMSYML